MLEHVQLDAAGIARIEVPMIFAGPAEGLAFDDLQSGEVDVAACEIIDVFLWEIVSDDAHEVYAGEETGADRSVTGRAAEQVGVFGDGSLDGVECDGTYNENGHGACLFGIREGEGGVERAATLTRCNGEIRNSKSENEGWRTLADVG